MYGIIHAPFVNFASFVREGWTISAGGAVGAPDPSFIPGNQRERSPSVSCFVWGLLCIPAPRPAAAPYVPHVRGIFLHRFCVSERKVQIGTVAESEGTKSEVSTVGPRSGARLTRGSSRSDQMRSGPLGASPLPSHSAQEVRTKCEASRVAETPLTARTNAW